MAIKRTAATVLYSDNCYLAAPYELKPEVRCHSTELQIFLHIPKCGGSTLQHLMAACAAAQNTRYLRFVVRDFFPGAYIGLGWTGAWKEVQRSARSRAESDHISGHFPFGVHRFFDRPHRYITLLRDPVRREVSSYNHMYQKGFIDGKIPLKQFIEQRLVLDNPQVRMVAGIDAMSGACTEDTYQTAVGNLEREFTLVGIVEEADSFIRALLALNQWPPTAYARAQITAIKALQKADDPLATMISEYHSMDVRLHRYASQRWHAWKEQCIRAEPVLDPDEDVVFIPPGFHKTRRWAIVKRSGLGRIASNIV